MSKLPIVFCRDCKFSEPDPSSTWQLRCHNPEVNRNDSWALSSGTDGRGTHCRTERDKKGWFSDCGRLGKLYEPKEHSQ